MPVRINSGTLVLTGCALLSLGIGIGYLLEHISFQSTTSNLIRVLFPVTSILGFVLPIIGSVKLARQSTARSCFRRGILLLAIFGSVSALLYFSPSIINAHGWTAGLLIPLILLLVSGLIFLQAAQTKARGDLQTRKS